MIGLSAGKPVILIILVVMGADSREPVGRNIIKKCHAYIIQIEIFITNDAGEKFQLKNNSSGGGQ